MCKKLLFCATILILFFNRGALGAGYYVASSVGLNFAKYDFTHEIIGQKPILIKRDLIINDTSTLNQTELLQLKNIYNRGFSVANNISIIFGHTFNLSLLTLFSIEAIVDLYAKGKQNHSNELKINNKSTFGIRATLGVTVNQYNIDSWYLLAGIGGRNLTVSYNTESINMKEDLNGTILILGAGINTKLTKNTLMFMEYNHHISLTKQDIKFTLNGDEEKSIILNNLEVSNFTIKIGVKYYIK